MKEVELVAKGQTDGEMDMSCAQSKWFGDGIIVTAIHRLYNMVPKEAKDV